MIIFLLVEDDLKFNPIVYFYRRISREDKDKLADKSYSIQTHKKLLIGIVKKMGFQAFCSSSRRILFCAHFIYRE